MKMESYSNIIMDIYYSVGDNKRQAFPHHVRMRSLSNGDMRLRNYVDLIEVIPKLYPDI